MRDARDSTSATWGERISIVLMDLWRNPRFGEWELRTHVSIGGLEVGKRRVCGSPVLIQKWASSDGGQAGVGFWFMGARRVTHGLGASFEWTPTVLLAECLS